MRSQDFRVPWYRRAVANVGLKSELYLLLLRQTGIGVGIGLLLSLLFRSYYAAGFCALVLILLAVLYRAWRRNHSDRAEFAYYLLFSIGVCLVLPPFMYFFCGGIYSGVPLIYLLNSIAITLLLDGAVMVVTLLASSAVFIGTLALDYHFPLLLTQFTDLGSHSYVVLPVTIAYVGLSLASIFRMLDRNFRENRKMAEELLRQLREVALKDPLSGAYDRGFLTDHLDECIALTKQGKLSTFSVIMFDIDFFKSINDEYGHLTGDACIRAMANKVKEKLRKEDILARYGGEEFVCVLPGAPESVAHARAERIRRTLAGQQLVEEVSRPVTISAGVATYQSGMTAEELLRLVDENLYLAKRRGRNRVVSRPGQGVPVLPPEDPYPYDPAVHPGRRSSDKNGPDAG